MDTPHASAAIRGSNSPENAERILAPRRAVSPTGAQGTAWDIGHAVLYLASPESAFVNGHALVVDGGYIWTTRRRGSLVHSASVASFLREN